MIFFLFLGTLHAWFLVLHGTDTQPVNLKASSTKQPYVTKMTTVRHTATTPPYVSYIIYIRFMFILHCFYTPKTRHYGNTFSIKSSVHKTVVVCLASNAVENILTKLGIYDDQDMKLCVTNWRYLLQKCKAHLALPIGAPVLYK